jgi:hypothetical protein
MITDTGKLNTEQQELLQQQTITFRKKSKIFQKTSILLNVHPDTVYRWYAPSRG